MTQISALRLICCSSSLYPRHLSVSPSFLSNPRYLLNCHRSTHTVKSSSARRGRKPTSGGTHFHQRRSSTLTEEMRKNKSPLQMHEMEQKNGVEGFNKRRAEGRDKSDMPRNLQLKSRKLNPVNTICYVQILGTGMDTQDTSPSVFLFFDKQRFIFNAGEGLQRFCTEHKIKLSKVDHVFLTRVSSETAGGLPGLLLTLAGIGEEGMSVKIWGPSDLKYLVDAMKSFIPNAAMVHTHSFGEAQFTNGSKAFDFHLGCFINPIVLIDDEVVRLSAILLRPKCSRGSSMKPGDVAVVYTCELPEIKGKFDPEKAISLGLKRGPKYGELQLGNSVMSDHLNIMVHPTDVLGPSSPGPIFLIVDCPTPAHTEELFSAQSLHSYYFDSLDIRREGTKVVNCIIHLGPAFVTKKTDYVTWMRRFGKAQHIMAGHEMKNMKIPILQSSAKISSRLNYLCPQLFPVPSLQVEVRSSLTDPLASCEVHSSEFTNWVSAENLLKFILRPYPQLGLDRSAIPSSLNYAQTINELLSEIPEINDVSKNISQLWSNHTQGKDVVEEPWIKEASALLDASDIPACMDNVTRDDMEIVLLGTGSSQPSKYRNVSSIYVNLFSKGGLLLDCGEGTLAQLKRRYGVEDADKKVQALKCIWISHIHADHHTGLARILALRSQLLKDVPHEPLLVIGPRQLKRFLDAYSILEDLDMLFLDCRHTTKASWYDYDEKEKGENGAESQNLETNLFSQGTKMQSYWKRPGSPVDIAAIMPLLRRLKELLCEAGLEALCSVPVIHCPEAFAIVLNAAERLNREGKSVPGWKLVYSGDTRPCQSLLDASHNATILIHEATFEDSMGEEAVARNHSTTMEAIQMGSRAGAYRIILTHFSQRYPKIPVFDEAHMHNTCIAFDLMSVNLADLPLLPSLLPYLKSLFRNEMAVDESDEVSDLAASQH